MAEIEHRKISFPVSPGVANLEVVIFKDVYSQIDIVISSWLISFCSTSKSFSILSKSIETSFSSENTLFSGGLISFSPELYRFRID